MQQVIAEQVGKTFIPDVATKELAINTTPAGERRIRLSTNFLRLMGWEPGTRHDVLPITGGGLQVMFNPTGTHKVYQRRYTTRKNNPLEAQLDIQSQALINSSIPAYTERVHFEMRRGKIVIRPLVNRTFSIRKSVEAYKKAPAAFLAMTSGIDARSMVDCGFDIAGLLEYRPQEARDSTDLTETGVMTALGNCRPRAVFNQDIFSIDMDMVKKVTKEGPPVAVLHMSPQCDDFSTAKTTAMRKASLEDLSTTSDMVYECLKLVEATQPGVVVIENVPGFGTSFAGELVRTKLRRFGYHVQDSTMDGRDYGGFTSRNRYFLVASVWPGFEFPKPVERRVSPIWNEIESFFDGCRDVSHTVSVQKGIETGRIRPITSESLCSPTLLKSQNRQTKDSVYIRTDDGRWLLPSNQLLSFLNGIPEDFSYDAVADTIASEQIGQSICYRTHHSLMGSVMQHIEANTGNRFAVRVAQQGFGF